MGEIPTAVTAIDRKIAQLLYIEKGRTMWGINNQFLVVMPNMYHPILRGNRVIHSHAKSGTFMEVDSELKENLPSCQYNDMCAKQHP